jgi:periplasmic protein TonB
MSYAHPHSSGRRVTGLVATVIFHIVLIYALINGLARKIVEVVAPPLETKIIAETKPPAPEKPPPPPPKFTPPPLPYIPPPEVQIQVPVQPPPTITVAPQPTPPPPVFVPTPAAPPAPAVSARPPIRIADSCDLRPPYSAAMRRAGEEGEVTIKALIDVTGRVLESQVERSSGFRRLDEASREAILSCRYRPGISADGNPVRMWVSVVTKWSLRD